MRDEYFAKQVSEHVKGGGQPNLNTGWLKEFKIIVPDLEQQKEFDVFFVNKLINQNFRNTMRQFCLIIYICIRNQKEVHMQTNFDYLKNEEKFSTFADVAISAEKIVLIDPEACVINCRRAMEFAVKSMYSNRKRIVYALSRIIAESYECGGF